MLLVAAVTSLLNCTANNSNTKSNNNQVSMNAANVAGSGKKTFNATTNTNVKDSYLQLIITKTNYATLSYLPPAVSMWSMHSLVICSSMTFFLLLSVV